MLMGLPSPSLASLERLNMVGLSQRIERLTDEVTRVKQKIERLRQIEEPPQQKIEELTRMVKRLSTLRQAAQDKLAFKVERKRRWDEKHGQESQL